MNVPEEIVRLIENKKEGAWWDFKLKHHPKNSSLIHDVLCMSNSVTGRDKFLIFGVCDDGVIEGINEQDRKKQPDIIGIFQGLNFSGKTPSLSLDYYDIDDVCIGVLTIKDMAYKPFFLDSKYSKEGRCIPAGVVYTRVGCRNTPIDRSAKDHDVEQMWKERFGIVEENKTIFDGEAYANVNYMVPVLFTSFCSLTFTFVYQGSGEIFTTVIDIEDFLGNNKVKFISGGETIEFHHEEICLNSKYSNFIYCHLNKSYNSNNIQLKRITGLQK